MRSTAYLLAAAALGLLGASANANVVAVFNGNAGNTYNYTIRFTVDQTGEQMRNGDFLTIVDVGNAATISSITAPAGFTLSQGNTSGIPTGIGPPAINDSATSLNLTFTRTGGTVTAATDFSGLQIVTVGNVTSTALGKATGTTSFVTLGDQQGLGDQRNQRARPGRARARLAHATFPQRRRPAPAPPQVLIFPRFLSRIGRLPAALFKPPGQRQAFV